MFSREMKIRINDLTPISKIGMVKSHFEEDTFANFKIYDLWSLYLQRNNILQMLNRQAPCIIGLSVTLCDGHWFDSSFSTI